MKIGSGVFLGILPVAFLTLTSAMYADTLVTNLANGANGSTNNAYVGQAFVTGTSPYTLNSVLLQLGYTPTAPQLEVEASNPDGTVSSTLYTISGPSNYSFIPGNLQITFTAPTNFTLAANTDYWLVLSDGGSATWDYTTLSAYTAAPGYSIPATDTAFQSTTDNSVSGTYYALGSRAELFTLTGTQSAAPEPSSFLYLLPLAGVIPFLRRRKA